MEEGSDSFVNKKKNPTSPVIVLTSEKAGVPASANAKYVK